MWEQLCASGTAAGQRALEELKQMDSNGGVPADRAAELAVFLASERSHGLTGRLVSAVHYDWKGLEPASIEAIAESEYLSGDPIFHLR
jgi:3-oxoacyl-[acyl-carrier protein] reductase